MSCYVPLAAADLGDLIPILVVIVFFILSAAGRLLAKGGAAQRPGGPRPQVPRAPRAEGDVEDEIAEFLRRAVQRQRPRPPQPRPAAPPPVAPQGVDAIEPEVIEPAPVGGHIEQHVGKYLGRDRLSRRAAHLGEEVARADDVMEQRLHARFDHQVSRLATTAGESAVEATVAEVSEPEDRITPLPSTAAAGLAALFGSAQTIRRAIIINEILNRPEHRWSPPE